MVSYHDTGAVAAAYLEYLYSEQAQRLVGQYYYRPSDKQVLAEYADMFDLEMELVDIDHFGGWRAAQQHYFADGGVFDQIYE